MSLDATPMNTTDPTIAITLDLFGNLRRYLPPGENGPLRLSCTVGTTVAGLQARLGIPPEEDAAVSLNGELGSVGAVLKDGDELILFGPSEGG